MMITKEQEDIFLKEVSESGSTLLGAIKAGNTTPREFYDHLNNNYDFRIAYNAAKDKYFQELDDHITNYLRANNATVSTSQRI